jgi:hypothetical protein
MTMKWYPKNIQALFGLLALILMAGMTELCAQQKFKNYYIQGDEVIFEFDLRLYEQAMKDDSLKQLDFADLDIDKVAVTGNFNNWSKNGWKMKKIGPYTYQLRKKLTEFNDLLTWEFKFLINGKVYVDPGGNGKLDEGVVPVDIWEGVYNLDIYDCEPVEKGNAYFFVPQHQNASEVILTGSFNGWNERKLKMNRIDIGWEVYLELPPGRYEYKFIIDGKWTHDRKNPVSVMNEHGTLNSVMMVGKSITFELNGYKDAKRVFLAGSFNNWNPTELLMQRSANGWTATVELPHGKHYYKFVIDGQWITDPGNPFIENDREGNLNSILLVQ